MALSIVKIGQRFKAKAKRGNSETTQSGFKRKSCMQKTEPWRLPYEKSNILQRENESKTSHNCLPNLLGNAQKYIPA